MAHNRALLCVAFSIQRQKNPNKKGVSRCKSWPKNKSGYSRCATYNDKTQFLTSVHSSRQNVALMLSTMTTFKSGLVKKPANIHRISF